MVGFVKMSVMKSIKASLVLQTVRSKRCRRDSEDSGEAESERPDVDLYQLQVQKARPSTEW